MSMSSHHEEPKTGIALLDKIFFDAETNRYGIISMLMLVVGIFGAVGVYTGGLQNTAELIILVSTTMFSLSMILAVAPMRVIVFSCLGSAFLSLIIVLLNLFVL